ncbi:sialin-like [Panonychus citri]|uniref:sialin-like n=1 Tax=Panonychus citri TaxID=50023 RepID=UPI00230767EB|nr:sialin-like [Panonychus citri]
MVNLPSKDEPRFKLRLLICLCSTMVHFTLSANRVALTISFEAMLSPEPDETISTSPVNSSQRIEKTTISKLSSSDHHKKDDPKSLKQLNVNKTVDLNQTKTNPYKVELTESTKDRFFEIIFFGGLISPIPTGRLADKYGPKLVVTILLLINAVVMSLFPMVASWSIYCAAALMFLKGAGTSPLFSCSSVLCAHWCPKYEKTMYVSTVATGSMMAIIAANPLSGFLCSLDFLGGWPLCFYLMGSINILVVCIWLLIVTNDPAEHPLISPAEKELVLNERTPIDEFNTKSPPYLKMLTCGPFWALIVAHFASSWFSTLISHQVPDYFKTVLHVSMTEDGIYSGLPYVGSAICLSIFSFIIDKLRANGKLSTTAIRKISADIGFIFAPAFMILSTFFGKNLIAVLACVCAAKAMAAAQFAGIYSVHLDIAPSYVGSLAGIIETVQNGASMAMNHATLSLIGDQPTLHHWSNLFLATAVVCIIGTHYFALLGSSKLQPWDPTFKSEEKAIEDDQNGDMSYPTIFDPEIYVVDARSGSIIRKHSISAASFDIVHPN